MIERVLVGADRPDVRWASGCMRLGQAPLLAALGRQDEAIGVVTKNMPVIERGFLGEGNLPLSVHWATKAVWLTQYTPLVARCEQVLVRKIIEPGFCYPGSDSHWDAALLAALQGRIDEARTWFESSYERLRRQEAMTLLPHVACDEALMELRLGPAGQRDNGRRRLDDARTVAQRIGLLPLVARIDHLGTQLDE